MHHLPDHGPRTRVISIVHGKQSNTGRLGRVVREKGLEEVRCCVKEGNILPEDFESIAGVMVFGGPMSANDDDKLDFIARELRWIDRVLDAGVPFLGVCLGAQMLARCLGAEVRSHDEGWHEIGFTRVVATEAGRDLLDGVHHFYQWHSEGFGLPAGCELLATSSREHFPNQMYRAGPGVYGVQFHPECTIDIIRHWMTEASHRLTEPGAQQPEEQLANAGKYDHLVDAWVPGFVDAWLDLPPSRADMVAA